MPGTPVLCVAGEKSREFFSGFFFPNFFSLLILLSKQYTKVWGNLMKVNGKRKYLNEMRHEQGKTFRECVLLVNGPRCS